MSLQADAPRLVLASGSAARRNMLAAAGLHFDVVPARVDEDALKRAARAEGAPAVETALMLAELKAQRVSAGEPQAVVIGADQLLVCEGEWFDKPADLAAAREQLRRLRGKRHMLATAVACMTAGRVLWHHVAEPRLLMRPISDTVLEDYLAAEAEHVTASVGAYRIETAGVQLFDAIEGDYFSVLGLPLLPLLGFLRQHGVLMS
jgi:septum formation protein